MKKMTINTRYPSIEDLRNRALQRIPRFAFEYLDGGCNEDINKEKNTEELRKKELVPYYLRDYTQPSIQTELFGRVYDAPFGIAPIGLQDLIWPNAAEILASSAYKHNIPFILSTVGTASIERIAEITEGNAWFQLYHPTENTLRDDIIKRLIESQYSVLVLLSDVPSFGFRPRDIRNGITIPPRMTMSNIQQILTRPNWAWQTLRYGQPAFKTMQKYMPSGLSMKQLGAYMNATFSGRLNKDKVKAIRDKWKGKLVLKGVASEEDVATAIQLGLDGVIVSNHGGRQLDAAQSAVASLESIAAKYSTKITIMMDSGLRSGPDIARALASGAEFTFLGRSFMYAVAALGKHGGEHVISMLKMQFEQILQQLCCKSPANLMEHVVTGSKAESLGK